MTHDFLNFASRTVVMIQFCNQQFGTNDTCMDTLMDKLHRINHWNHRSAQVSGSTYIRHDTRLVNVARNWYGSNGERYRAFEFLHPPSNYMYMGIYSRYVPHLRVTRLLRRLPSCMRDSWCSCGRSWEARLSSRWDRAPRSNLVLAKYVLRMSNYIFSPSPGSRLLHIAREPGGSIVRSYRWEVLIRHEKTRLIFLQINHGYIVSTIYYISTISVRKDMFILADFADLYIVRWDDDFLVKKKQDK